MLLALKSWLHSALKLYAQAILKAYLFIVQDGILHLFSKMIFCAQGPCHLHKINVTARI